MKALLDFIPLVVFLALAKTMPQDTAIFMATQGLVISSIIVYSLHFFLQQWKLEKQQWVTLILTLVFGGMTLYFHDVTWVKWKATAIYWLFGTAFLLSPVFGKTPTPLAKRFLDSALELSDQTWKKLNLIWAIFFYSLGALQLYVAFIFPDYWVDFKVFGCSGIMILFMVAQFVVLRHHFRKPENVEKH